MRSFWLTLAGWLALGPALYQAAEPRRQAPEQKALAYLGREVPRWQAENKCYSCHNNGDAARALYTAARKGFALPSQALADTTAWLSRPLQWDKNGADKEFSDKKLARLQFAAALAAARAAGRVKDHKPLDQAARSIAGDQQPNGSWPIDAEGNAGSPITYGTALATFMARQVLHQTNPRRYRKEIARADQWFRKAPVKNVLDAAAVLLGLGGRSDAAALAQTKHCLALIRKGESRDGGWGPYVTAASEPFDTAVVLLALSQYPKQEGGAAMIRRGRAYLVAAQEHDGSWPATTRPAGRTSYAQQVSTTAWAALALLTTAPKER